MEPVNLTNLRSMTDGDEELEKALFAEFISSFDLGIAELNQTQEPDFAETWRKQAHALKGISLSLGAEKLGELCKSAQDNFEASPQEKKQLTGEIEQEYALVKQYLQALTN